MSPRNIFLGMVCHFFQHDSRGEAGGKQGAPLSNTIKDTSTIMRNPSLHNSGKGLRMIVLVSLIVLLRGFPCFHDFSHSGSHPYIPIHSFFALVYTSCSTV